MEASCSSRSRLQHELRFSSRHYWHLGWDSSLLWVLPRELWDTQQLPWPPPQMAVAPPTPTAIIENVSGHRQMSCWDAIIIFPSGDSLEQIVANFMSQEAKKQISINLDLKTSEPQASDYALTLGSTLDSSLVGEIMVGFTLE